MSVFAEYDFSGPANTPVAGQLDQLGHTMVTPTGAGALALTGTGAAYATQGGVKCIELDMSAPPSTDYTATATAVWTQAAAAFDLAGPWLNGDPDSETGYTATQLGGIWSILKYLDGNLAGSATGGAFAPTSAQAYPITIGRVTSSGVASITASYADAVVCTYQDSSPLPAGYPGVFISAAASSPSATVGPQVSALSAATPAPPAPTITAPPASRGFQQVSGVATIPISGTNADTSPHSIQANWSGGGSTWTTIATNVAAGATFAGSLAGQPIGEGTLTLRYADATSVTATVADVRVGDVILPAGQSNMVGQGTSSQAALLPIYGSSTYTYADTWVETADPVFDGAAAVDPIYQSFGGSAGGSMWPLVVTMLTPLADRPIILVPAAHDASGLLPGTSQYTWLPIPQVIDGTTLFGALILRYRQAGGAVAIPWLQGENDAGNNVTQAQYFAGLQTLDAAVFAETGLHLMACKLYNGAITTGGEPAIQAAIEQFWQQTPGVPRGADFSVITADNPPHVTTTAGLSMAAGLMARKLVDNLYSTAVFPPVADVIPSAGAYGPDGDDFTGTYSAAGASTDPGIANVRKGTAYEINGTNLTGTYDPITGAFTNPGAANVEAGTGYLFAGEAYTGTFEGSGPPGITEAQMVALLAAGVVLAPAGLDQVVVEPGINARQALAPVAAFAGGPVSGAAAGGSTIVVRALGSSPSNGPPRVTATTDAFGNRTTVTLNLPD